MHIFVFIPFYQAEFSDLLNMTLSECSDDCAYDADFLPRPEMSQLPAVIKGRINALKNLQLNTIKVYVGTLNKA